MTGWTAATVAEALGLPAPASHADFSGVGTDSRAIATGALFVALHGERFDGHDFLPAVRDAGALGAVVRQGTAPVPGLVLFHVEDTLEALGQLAAYRRRQIPGPVVAITDSFFENPTRS